MNELINPGINATASHFTDIHAMSMTGPRVEASTTEVGGRSGQLAAAVEVGDETEAIITRGVAAYSKSLFFSGGFGGGLVALSTRARRFERKPAGFCPPWITISIARSIGNRTTPLFLLRTT